MTPPLVSIRCLVYNHEPFLRDCLEGFVMQQTDFPFEAIVHDDASTDRSADIIREYAKKYPHIIKPIYETENLYSRKDGSLGRIVDAAISHHCKYVAYCEGDDYWTDPLKLQKQVDYMQGHPECSMCFHSYKRLVVENRDNDSVVNVEDRTYDCSALLNGCFPQTATTMYRKDVVTSEVYAKAEPLKQYGAGDVVLVLSAVVMGQIHGLSDIMSVYRSHPGGVSYAWGKSVQSIEKLCSLSLAIPDIFGEQFRPGFTRGACNGYKQCIYISIRQGKIGQALFYLKKIVTTVSSPMMFFELVSREVIRILKKWD